MALKVIYCDYKRIKETPIQLISATVRVTGDKG
jgi:hypothetical protein